MGVQREGFDLFNKHGRSAFLRNLRKGRFVSLMWGDTFMRFVCYVTGHKIYDANFGGCPPELACLRCHKYINDSKKGGA